MKVAIPLIALFVGAALGFLWSSWNQLSSETRAYEEAIATSDWMLNRLLAVDVRCDNDLWRDLVGRFLRQQKYLSIAEEVDDVSISRLASESFEGWKDHLYFLAGNERNKNENTACVEVVQEIGLYSTAELKKLERGT